MDWISHIEAAQREGKTLSSYAREHGLSVHDLYKARRRMRPAADAAQKKAHKPAATARDAVSAFAEVKVSSAPGSTAPRARLWAHLPNGVSVEFLCTSADVALLTAMMDSLGRTACSASTTI